MSEAHRCSHFSINIPKNERPQCGSGYPLLNITALTNKQNDWYCQILTILQVLSRTVAAALLVYEKLEKQKEQEGQARNWKFNNTKPVSDLFFLLDQCFDVMNARIPKNGINHTNWDTKKQVCPLSPFPQLIVNVRVTAGSFET